MTEPTPAPSSQPNNAPLEPQVDDLAPVPARLANDPGWTPWPPPRIVASTISTMVDVENLAGAEAPEGTVVVADEQTAGRGRLGRTWQSQAGGGLWFSLLLRPTDATPAAVGRLPLVAGVAVAAALEGVAGTDAGISLKWPNDVVTADGTLKLCGILAERLADGAVVLGIGVNVRQGADHLPSGGTSLTAEVPSLAGRDDLRQDLLVALLTSIAETYRRWARGEWSMQEYRDRCITLGRAVTVTHRGGDDLAGTAVDVDTAGHLVVVTSLGERIVVTAGDVSVRASGEQAGLQVDDAPDPITD